MGEVQHTVELLPERCPMSTQSSSLKRPVRPESPHLMWRQICWVSRSLAVSGDLSYNREAARIQLSEWEAAGITDVFDMRGEADDTQFIHENSSITSHWFGVDDNGGKRDDAWFEGVRDMAYEVLNDFSRDRKILVHCHMGVNRGPSALFAIMLATGWESLEALRAIRDVRPIAGIIYAPDAISWWARVELRHDEDDVAEKVQEVRAWLDRNPLDLGYVIRSIGNRLAV